MIARYRLPLCGLSCPVLAWTIMAAHWQDSGSDEQGAGPSKAYVPRSRAGRCARRSRAGPRARRSRAGPRARRSRAVSIEDRTLLQWLDEPPTGRGLHFSGSANTWAFWPYAELAALTLRTAAALSARRLRGGVVVIIQRSSPGLVASLCGTLAAGATACSVAPPLAIRRSAEHERHLSHLLAPAQPALVITDTDSISHLQRLTGRLGLSEPLLFDELIADVVPTAGPAPPAELALLQFTSGSTGFSRAVRVPNSAVQANATAMRRWLHWTPEFSGISWLPMHHDMGLIGCLLNIVVTGRDSWMMQP